MNRNNSTLRLGVSGHSERSGAVAALLSFIFPGLGQAYLGNRRAAIVFATPIVALLAFLLVLLGTEGLTRFGTKFLNPTTALFAAFVSALVALWWAAGVVNAFRAGRHRSPSAALLPAVLVALLAVGTAIPLFPPGAAWFYQLSVGSQSYQQKTDCDPTIENCDTSTPTPAGSAIAVVPTPTESNGSTFPPDDTPEPTEPPATIIPGPSPSFDITKIDAQSDGWLNVLLLGLDTRCAGGLVTGANTDTMIVVSANATTGEVYEFSFPRDLTGFPLYIGGTMPGYWKLNTFAGYTKQHPEDFPDPGQPALAYEIGYLLGIPIDYYASINICGFPQLIDEVGGVDVCNTKQIDDPGYHWSDGHLGYELAPGEYHLDGENALAYARSRHGSSDFARAKRQQQLLSALRVQILAPQNLARLPQIVSAVGDIVHTNFPLENIDQLLALAGKMQDNPAGAFVFQPPVWATHPPINLTNGRSIQILNINAVAALSINIFGDKSLYKTGGAVPSVSPVDLPSPTAGPSESPSPC